MRELGEENRGAAGVGIALILAAGVVMFVLTRLHTPGLNGPSYWPWDWRRLPGWRVYPVMGAAMLPMAGAVALFELRGWSAVWRRVAVGLLGVQVVVMTGAVVEVQWPGWAGAQCVEQLIRNSNASGYLPDAVDLSRREGMTARGLLGSYPTVMAELRSHPRDKPPGAVWTYFVMVRVMSERAAAWVSAGTILACTGLGVVWTYLLVARVLKDPAAGFYAAALISICPGMVGFFPNFDSAYVVLACEMMGLWAGGMERGRPWMAAAFGGVLALTFFYTYNLLVLGVFLLGFGVGMARVEGLAGRALGRRLMVQATIALVVAVGLYAVLWGVTGFDPVATLRVAMRNQEENLAHMVVPRPLRLSWNGDLFDYALGAGWLAIGLMTAGYWRVRGGDHGGHGDGERARRLHGGGELGSGGADWEGAAARWRWWMGMAVVQLGVVAGTGLLQAENARVWAFLFPLVMAPAGMEVSRWPRWGRVAAVGVAGLILMGVVQNMGFMAD